MVHSPKRRLLIVDDDDCLRQALALQLSSTWEVVEASDGAEALAVCREAPPDIVLTDWVMPGLHGEELLRALRKHDATMPIVVMTGKSSEGKAVAAVGLACAYLRKPFGYLAVDEALRRCLDDMAMQRGHVPQQKGQLSFCRYAQQVAVAGRVPATLTAAELNVFILLWDNVGKVIPHRQIADTATGHTHDSDEEAAPVGRYYVHRLRRKLEADPRHPRFITTVRGRGVKLLVDAAHGPST